MNMNSTETLFPMALHHAGEKKLEWERKGGKRERRKEEREGEEGGKEEREKEREGGRQREGGKEGEGGKVGDGVGGEGGGFKRRLRGATQDDDSEKSGQFQGHESPHARGPTGLPGEKHAQ